MSAPTLPEGFDCWSEFMPSRYWMHSDPSKNYGVSNVKIVFYLRGPAGAIQFMVGTEWGVEKVRRHLEQFPVRNVDEYRMPHGRDLGYHAHKPQYDGQSKMGDDCDVLGGACYYDGSSLAADDVVEGFLAGGTDWLWPKLLEVYRNRFEDAPYPDFTPAYKAHPSEGQS